jgi:hypothetical protein
MKKPLDLKQDVLLARALEALDAGGLSAAVSVIESSDNPLGAGTAFAEFGKRLYRERKNVAGMIAVGDAGVTFCLQQATNATDAATAEQLKKLAKVIAFNTAANSWPGWGDEGIHIEQGHLQSGSRLAVICRDLVHELHLDHREVGNAHWLVGALELAAGRPAEALSEFQRAEQVFEQSGHPAYGLLARGYVALARKAELKSAASGARDLVQVLKQLRDLGSKDAVFFADQLVVADRILLVP